MPANAQLVEQPVARRATAGRKAQARLGIALLTLATIQGERRDAPRRPLVGRVGR